MLGGSNESSKAMFSVYSGKGGDASENLKIVQYLAPSDRRLILLSLVQTLVRFINRARAGPASLQCPGCSCREKLLPVGNG